MQIDLNTLTHEHCVYSYSILPDELIYIGCCKTHRLMEFKDARDSQLFRSITALNPRATVKIEFRTMNAHDAKAYQQMLVAMKAPPCNLNYTPAYPNRRGMPVECNETGARYINASEAARDQQVSLTTMSNHLARRKGYGKVKGKTFKRVAS